MGDKNATAVLYDNPTSKDFLSLVPLTVDLEVYSEIEKIFQPPRRLTSKDAPKGFKPSIGDLTYYAPWGNIALFNKNFGYAKGLISLGRITNGFEHFKTDHPMTIKIELENET